LLFVTVNNLVCQTFCLNHILGEADNGIARGRLGGLEVEGQACARPLHRIRGTGDTKFLICTLFQGTGIFVRESVPPAADKTDATQVILCVSLHDGTEIRFSCALWLQLKFVPVRIKLAISSDAHHELPVIIKRYYQ
jgi:hypothetical protein